MEYEISTPVLLAIDPAGCRRCIPDTGNPEENLDHWKRGLCGCGQGLDIYQRLRKPVERGTSLKQSPVAQSCLTSKRFDTVNMACNKMTCAKTTPKVFLKKRKKKQKNSLKI